MSTQVVPATQAPGARRNGTEVEQIRTRIEQTQAELARTVSELQDRLTVSHVVGEARRGARQTVRSWAGRVKAVATIAGAHLASTAVVTQGRVKRRSAPTLMIGGAVAAGLAAVLWHRGRSRRTSGV